MVQFERQQDLVGGGQLSHDEAPTSLSKSPVPDKLCGGGAPDPKSAGTFTPSVPTTYAEPAPEPLLTTGGAPTVPVPVPAIPTELTLSPDALQAPTPPSGMREWPEVSPPT